MNLDENQPTSASSENAPNSEQVDSKQAFYSKLLARLEIARSRLVDRNLRNRLISTNLNSTRSKNIRFFNGNNDEIFHSLFINKHEMLFGASDDAPDVELALEDKSNQNIDQLLPELNNGDSIVEPLQKKDQESSSKPKRINNILQTRIEKISLQKKLRSLYYEANEYEEEQGVNILFIAMGFLKWYEDDKSDIERFAPLVLLPVELLKDGAKDKFKLRPRDEDLFTNISLKLWLREQNNIDLPDIPEEDSWQYKDYCQKVRESISQESRWEVLQDDVVLGFFSFNKFLLWRDLDPENWPAGFNLLDHPIVQRLLMPPSQAGEPDPPIVPSDELIDDFFTPQDLVYVVDADSSQTEAIQTVLSGRDMVIQGPPGTGKSQTITNIIAAAVADGKRVLFIAEKMAALNVVHDRLTKVGLDVICLELHSRKATKSSVLKQIGDSVEFAPQPGVSDKAFTSLKQSQDFLNKHTKSVNGIREPWNMSPYQVMGEIAKMHRLGLNVFNFDIPNSLQYTLSAIDELTGRLDYLCERLKKSGVPAGHPWRLSQAAAFTPMDLERMVTEINALTALSDSLVQAARKSAKEFGLANDAFDKSRLNLFEWICNYCTSLDFAPEASKEVLASDKLIAQATSLRNIAETIKTFNNQKAVVSQNFINGWEAFDLATLRVNLAGSGGSLFSIFNSTYRQSIASLKGLLTTGLPSGFHNRLSLIDKALALKIAKEDLNQIDPQIKAELGVIWRGADTNVDLLLKLSNWFDSQAALNQEQLQFAKWLVMHEQCKFAVSVLSTSLSAFNKQLQSVCAALKVDQEIIRNCELIEISRITNEWRDNLDRLNEWPSVRSNLAELINDIGQDCYNKIYYGEIQADHISAIVRSSILEKIWQAMVEQDPYLSEIDAFKLDRELSIFRRTDKERLQIAAKEILGGYSNNLPRGNSGAMAIIRQELAKKRNNLAVRRLIDKAGMAVSGLKPVFLMSPMSIAQFIAPGAMTFDLVLIDEASQVKPEDALGAIARARQVVVVGDAKQLPPTNFFNRFSDETDYEDSLDDDGSYLLSDVESILGLCDGVFQNKCMLRWHYRSQHPGLIAVSNKNFYDGKLLLPPSVLRSNYADGYGVSFVRSPPNGYIRGGSDGGRNVLEAELIAKEVIAFAKAHPDKSLGVAAFSVTQRDCLRDLIDAERLKHPETEVFFSDSRHEPFFVKNLESIQGDERDVIFISVGYGRSEDGRLTQTFGPLAADGGERRLNVLISRAKERCTVFSSITSEDIRNESGKLGVGAFKEFLQYAEKGYFDVPINTNKDFDSDFEESVALFLGRHGYKIEPQVGMVGFFIDLGVIDPGNEGKYYCGIECDGATYHSSRSARDRDRLKQEILESRGWKIYRIWSTDWFHRRADQEAKLLDYLHALKLNPKSNHQIQDEPAHDELLVQEIYESNSQEPNDKILTGVLYQEFDELVSHNKAPHDLSAFELSRVIKKIVDLEAPIHHEEVARRVAKAFGLEKAGSRIQTATLNSLSRHQMFAQNGKFWRSDAPLIKQVRIRSNVRSKTLFQADNLPPEEIMWAIEYIVSDSVQIEEVELITQVSKLFGFLRCGPDLKQAIQRVIASGIGKNLLLHNKMISLSK